MKSYFIRCTCLFMIAVYLCVCDAHVLIIPIMNLDVYIEESVRS